MRLVLEVGDWVLAEDDKGEVRLWSNGVTGETRSYEDVPKEVEEYLASDAGPPPSQPAAQPLPSQQAPADAQPFRRARGMSSEPTASSTALAGATDSAVPFTRQRGAAAAPPQQGSTVHQPVADTLDPSPLQTAGAAVGSTSWPDMQAADEPIPSPGASYEPAPAEVVPVAEDASEPEPTVTRPDNISDLPPREPTAAILMKATTMRHHSGQPQAQFLEKLTHLHLADRGFTTLAPAFRHCPRLKVLYLDRNHIQELSGLRPCCEALHLQGNDVWELGSWTQNLSSLTTLELSENRLSILSGLRKSRHLEDLNLRGQRCDKPLKLHAPTLRVFSMSLKSLNISRNRMTDIEVAPVASLRNLERLDMSGNMLADMTATGSVLQALPRLARLSLQENPVCWMRKYRDMVVVSAGQCLVELDGKAVQPNERPFLLELHQRRRHRNSSEPPRRGNRSPAGETPVASYQSETPVRSVSLGRAPPPPKEQAPPGVPCLGRNRSRSSSVEPALRHYRKRNSANAKLPPLPPRIAA